MLWTTVKDHGQIMESLVSRMKMIMTQDQLLRTAIAMTTTLI